MSGGEALDLALGLLRAPSRRELLAARPLPEGMTTLLEVAGGSSSAARAAATATGASPPELREAARFFVQQVLFHEGANAYRVLGADPSASQSTLSRHHRLLQRWLHPDRDGGDAWDSAFSARVNEAWARVRTEQARRAYDAELPGLAAKPHPGTETEVAPTPIHSLAPLVSRRGLAAPPNPAGRLAGPLAVLAAVLLCIWLAWLLYQRDVRDGPQGDLPAARPQLESGS